MQNKNSMPILIAYFVGVFSVINKRTNVAPFSQKVEKIYAMNHEHNKFFDVMVSFHMLDYLNPKLRKNVPCVSKC